MVFPLTKLNKEGTLLNASNAYYSEEYAQRMCSLYLTDELSRDETGKIKKTYRLHASNDHTEEMAFAYEIHCPKCGNHLKQIIISEYMPDVETGTKPIAFGDFSYYWIVGRKPVMVRTLLEKFVLYDQIGYLAFEFLDGKLVRNEAIKVIQMADAGK